MITAKIISIVDKWYAEVQNNAYVPPYPDIKRWYIRHHVPDWMEGMIGEFVTFHDDKGYHAVCMYVDFECLKGFPKDIPKAIAKAWDDGYSLGKIGMIWAPYSRGIDYYDYTYNKKSTDNEEENSNANPA